jgi:anti-sigma factor RsiW
MNHLSFEILNQFLDQQLAPSERDAAQAHLAACAECRAELGALKRVMTTLASLTPEPLPIELTPRVLAQIKPAQRAWWVDALIVAETVAAIALAVWLGETLVPLFDLLPDVGAEVLAFQQEVSDALNAITIEPLQGIVPTEWLALGAVVFTAWLITNWFLIRIPKQKEVFV